MSRGFTTRPLVSLRKLQKDINMEDFNDIRPYNDSEIAGAMQRISESDLFPVIAKWVFPDRPIDDVREQLLKVKSIREFQYQFMRYVCEQVIKRGISKLTYSGFEQLHPGEAYLFISNHRDIMIDAALLQYLLTKHGLDTTQITFGANLMSPGLVTDIGKSNKMFRVERGGKMRDFYMSSAHLSNYIREEITQKKESVWIAQRNGRTKDGNDKTDQGIIKMFCMSMPEDKIRALNELHIVPVCMSYENESCDILKALELYESRFCKYIKKPGEDLNSILTGIKQKKGHVNLTICPPISHEELSRFDSCTNNDYHKKVAELIDKRIYEAYQLMPNNFIAHDMLYGQNLYKDKYTRQQKANFLSHMRKLDNYDMAEPDVLKEIFLGIYANPVNNKRLLMERQVVEMEVSDVFRKQR